MPTRLPPKYPLVRYLKVENAYTSQIKDVLEQAAKNIDGQIRRLGTGGNPLTRLQLEAQRTAIKAQLRQTFSGDIRSIIEAGQKAAAADAIKVIGEYEKELLAALGNADYYDDIVRAEAARASAGINRLMSRYSSSYKPLSERVYRAGSIGNGAIDKAINVALVSGSSARDFAKSIRSLIDPSVPGGVSYAAMRTARTEINNANHAASQERYAKSSIVEAVTWHLSTSHPEGDICDSLVSDSPYKINEVPEKPHPQCLCYTTPDLPDRKEFLDRLLRGDYGDEPWEMDAKTSDGALKALTGVKPSGAPKFLDKNKILAADQDAILARLRQTYENRKFGEFTLRIDLAGLSEVRRKVNVEMTILNKSGKEVGMVQRTFSKRYSSEISDDIFDVFHDLMKLDKAAQGKGFSTAFSEFSEAWYKESGFNQIRVHAALTDGGYAWARAGYIWDPELALVSRNNITGKIQNLIDSIDTFDFNKIDEGNRAIMEGFLKRFQTDDYTQWPSPAEIAMSGGNPVYGGSDTGATGPTNRLGKIIMTGTDWHGIKLL